MKLSSSSSSSLSKPISSPGRQKFPPPLMRFLRTSLGSRSRPRSRPSPLFLRKKNTNSATQEVEPSSPKVTCIGQVRVRRSKNSAPRKPSPKKKKNRFHYSHCKCKFFPNPCGSISWKMFRPDCRMWVRGFCCGSVKVRTNSAQDRSKSKSNRVDEEETEDERETGFGVAASASTPPKNALLLTRCRSAPYRSSSLACRFMGSPLRREERETEEEISDSGSEPSGRDSVQETRGDRGEKTGEGSIGNHDAIDRGLKERPPLMMLKRCRSEPARKGSEELDPLASMFWRERRLSNTESGTPQSGD